MIPRPGANRDGGAYRVHLPVQAPGVVAVEPPRDARRGRGATGCVPQLASRKAPVPYVHFASPGRRHDSAKSALPPRVLGFVVLLPTRPDLQRSSRVYPNTDNPSGVSTKRPSALGAHGSRCGSSARTERPIGPRGASATARPKVATACGPCGPGCSLVDVFLLPYLVPGWSCFQSLRWHRWRLRFPASPCREPYGADAFLV